ncbi:hypothetical protein CCH79_00020616 [Gambusia affinis]|uniref:Uncharacterized protein n=1 Tax=Gambusia affinis TaxID=33528 RepID=A0A315VY79_GAMAF|nr:hypothetical protein CCH79_00020616 [Gambusia affinis]
MEKNISLFDLLNLSIGSPHKSSVNFGALHALLLEMLKLLDLREATTLFKFSPPGDRVPDAPLGAPVKVPTHPSVSDQLVPPGSDLQKLTESVSVLDGTGGDDFRTSGDGVSQVRRTRLEPTDRTGLGRSADWIPSEPRAADRYQLTRRADGETCRLMSDGPLELRANALNLIEELQRNRDDMKQKTEHLQFKLKRLHLVVTSGFI